MDISNVVRAVSLYVSRRLLLSNFILGGTETSFRVGYAWLTEWLGYCQTSSVKLGGKFFAGY
jgi:hypothetical protein